MASSTGKIKIYKNPDRNRPSNPKPYVPQYQLMGIEPEDYHSPSTPGHAAKLARPQPLPKDNPRAKRPLIRPQPYAETIPSPIGRGRGLLPNVGNNLEQTWSGVDGEIIDDLQLDPHQEMIDNNDYVSAEALGIPSNNSQLIDEDELQAKSPWPPPAVDIGGEDVMPHPLEKNFLTENNLQNSIKDEYLSTVVKNLEDDDYLLIVDGAAICSGPMEEIQEQARALVFGEHPLCDGNPMPIDDIVILKKTKIKVGLFLE